MTVTFDTARQAPRIAARDAIAGLVAAIAAGWREWSAHSTDRDGLLALSRLDDRLLRDMGLDPEDVRARSGEPLRFGLAWLAPRSV